MCYHLCDLWTELTDSSVGGALGFFDIFLRSVFVPKNFGFSDWVFIMDFPSFSIWFSVFVINTCLMGFGFGFQCGFRIFLSGFRFLFDLIGHYAPPLIPSCRETSVCSTCQHCIGSIRVLKTEIWTLKDFDGFAWGFRFWSNLFCGFAVVDNFFDGLEVSNGPSHSSVQWSSTRVLVLQIENLSF